MVVNGGEGEVELTRGSSGGILGGLLAPIIGFIVFVWLGNDAVGGEAGEIIFGLLALACVGWLIVNIIRKVVGFFKR